MMGLMAAMCMITTAACTLSCKETSDWDTEFPTTGLPINQSNQITRIQSRRPAILYYAYNSS